MALGDTGEAAKKRRAAKAKAEEKRLLEVFAGIEESRKKTVLGLIRQGAFMLVQLEELKEDIQLNGVTERFSQGDQEPYDRERPSSKIYNQMNGSYQKLIKQLTDLLPKEEQGPKGGDPFESF